MIPNIDLAWADLIDRLTDPPSDGPVQRWVFGTALPIASLTYGMSWILDPPDVFRLRLPGRYGSTSYLVTSTSVHIPIALGCLLICIALYMHFHWFWGNHRRLSRWYELLQLLSLFGLAAFLLYGAIAIFLTT